MFYRRKIILALLQIFEGQIEKISLQKLIFLFTRSQALQKIKPTYDFVPYKFGCYSYSANADLTKMVSSGILSETETHFAIKQTQDYFKGLNEFDKKLLKDTKLRYGNMTANALMKHTYTNFPYWAINSIKSKTLLSPEEFENVQNVRPKGDKTILFTMGYEGISLEAYLNRLIENDIKILIDVRHNPLSMKYGFSKVQLQRFSENLGIRYMHFPEVGIQSAQRQELNKQSDYDRLFAVYRQDHLTKTLPCQIQILNLLQEYKRVCLTCFEANVCQCHRKYLAEAIEKQPNFEYEIKHI